MPFANASFGHRPSARFLRIALLAIVGLFCSSQLRATAAEAEKADIPPEAPAARLLRVTLPLTGDADKRLEKSITQFARKPHGAQRPLLVLEFTSGFVLSLLVLAASGMFASYQLAANSAFVAAVPPAAREVTGSITQPATTPAPKPEVARLPTLEGWVLRDVADGGALIEGRYGVFEVYAGDPIPGLGRVDAIRRQDGRWVVVTSKGLIVAR